MTIVRTTSAECNSGASANATAFYARPGLPTLALTATFLSVPAQISAAEQAEAIARALRDVLDPDVLAALGDRLGGGE